MRWVWLAAMFGAMLPAMPAGVIDVAHQSSQTLRSGDTLAFWFADANFVTNAASFGISGVPASVSFSLMSAPVGTLGQFAATLQSADGSAWAAFPGSLTWFNGQAQSGAYTGAVSDLAGSLTLSSALSQQIFANQKAVLLLTYTGPDITVSFPGHTLEQDFSMSVAGGGLATGAVNYDVTLSGGDTPSAAAPEPSSALLLVGFGAVFFSMAAWLHHRRT